jgi:hypothetical protein
MFKKVRVSLLALTTALPLWMLATCTVDDASPNVTIDHPATSSSTGTVNPAPQQ